MDEGKKKLSYEIRYHGDRCKGRNEGQAGNRYTGVTIGRVGMRGKEGVKRCSIISLYYCVCRIRTCNVAKQS